MIVCTRHRTFMRGSILTIALAFANITVNVFQFLARYMGEGTAARIILICAKAALEEETECEDTIVQALIEETSN